MFGVCYVLELRMFQKLSEGLQKQTYTSPQFIKSAMISPPPTSTQAKPGGEGCGCFKSHTNDVAALINPLSGQSIG